MRVVIRRETTARKRRAVDDDYDHAMENKRNREGSRRKKSKGKSKKRKPKAIASEGGPGREAKGEGTGEETAKGLAKAHRQVGRRDDCVRLFSSLVMLTEVSLFPPPLLPPPQASLYRIYFRTSMACVTHPVLPMSHALAAMICSAGEFSIPWP